MDDIATLPAQEYLPADVILDESHPASDAYLQQIRHLERDIALFCAKMPKKHVKTAKLSHLGLKTSEIAEKVGTVPDTVRKTLKRPQTLELLALLSHLSLLHDGPQQAQRKHMLWRIAVKNEDKDPRTAIAALAEINRMEHAIKVLEKDTGSNVIQIQINNEALPRGALD